MKRTLPLIMLLVTSVASADLMLIVRKDGSLWEYDTSTGVTTPSKLSAVYNEQDGGTPTPPGPIPPIPPVASDFAKEVKGWADEIDDSVGNAIYGEGVYGTLEKEMRRGGIPVDANSVDEAITKALSTANRMYPGDDAREWELFNKKVIAELNKRLIAGGGDLTQADYVTFFGEVSNGLKVSNAGNAIPVWLAPIIAELVKIILRMLQDLFASSEQETLRELAKLIYDVSLFAPRPSRNIKRPTPRVRNGKGA